MHTHSYSLSEMVRMAKGEHVLKEAHESQLAITLLRVKMIQLGSLHCGSIDNSRVKALAEDIRVNGLYQPILVRLINKKYEVIVGRHRYMAYRLLKRVAIPAIIHTVNSQQAECMRMIHAELSHATGTSRHDQEKSWSFQKDASPFNCC